MKKNTIIALTTIGVLLVTTIGATFAYFASSIQNEEAGINVDTEELGSILLDGVKVFTSYDLLPGQMGVQEFTIEKDSDKGRGIYEIDLDATIPEEFRGDIEVLLYKTTEPITNHVTVNVADPTLEDDQIYQEDSLNITGSPELVYQGTLTENPQIILEQVDFDVTTLEKTTYYLVYHYKNNGNQDDQQGKTFTGTISVRLIGEKIRTASEVILELAESNPEELVYDETSDNNLRYVGANPDNYVSFNNELWRIIGVMNHIDDGTGKKETRLKIVKANFIYQSAGYNNDWSKSVLQEYLNTTYLNTLDLTSQSMIDDALWNLGGVSDSSSEENYPYKVGINELYQYERSDAVYPGNALTWTGKIALMYPSDYGYATSGGSATDRTTCLTTSLMFWNSSPDCYGSDWISDLSGLLLTHVLSDKYTMLMNLGTNVALYSLNNFPSEHIYPTIYLSSDVKISGGSGKESDPFVLS